SVHGLQHVQCLFAANLAEHHAVGTHTEGVDDELALADRAAAFDVGRASLKTDYVFLAQLQFGRVFDGDDALALRDKAGERVQQCGLTGTGTARDNNVQTRLNATLKEFQHGRSEGLKAQEILGPERIGAKAPDGEDRAVHSERRNDRVNARAIRETGVHHRRRLVHAAAYAGDDLVDDVQQMAV